MDEVKRIREAAENYLLAEMEFKKVRSAYDALEEPKIPDVISCQEDYELYSKKLTDYNKIKKVLGDAHGGANYRAHMARADLRNSFPVDVFDIWFEVKVNSDMYRVRYGSRGLEVLSITEWKAIYAPETQVNREE